MPLDLRENATSLSGIAAFNGTSVALEDAASSVRAWLCYGGNDQDRVSPVTADPP